MRFIFDTETTGLVAWHLPAQDDCQPRLVQLAGLVVDDRWQEKMVLSVVVEPDGFGIPGEAQQVHGITTEYAKAHGIPLRTVLSLFNHMVRAVDEVWAYNSQYDETVMRGEFHRIGHDCALSERPLRCAMLACKDILKLPQPANDRRIYPGRKEGDWKYPSLAQACGFFCCAGGDRAHDALADVRATARVIKSTEAWLQVNPQPAEFR